MLLSTCVAGPRAVDTLVGPVGPGPADALTRAPEAQVPTRSVPGAARRVTWTVRSHLVDPRDVSGTMEAGSGPVQVNIQLPRHYREHPSRVYPLLVLLHGAGGSSDTWMEKGRLGSAKSLDGVIVVSLEGGTFGMYTDWVAGGEAQWKTLHDEILARVMRELRVAPGRRNRAIAGVSMGGQGALRYASARPDIFGSVAAISPGLPNMRDPQIYATYPIQIGMQAGEPVSYEDTWGPVNGANAVGRNPQDLTANLQHSRVFISSGDGVLCPYESAEMDSPVKSATEVTIAEQVPAYAAAARSSGASVVVSQHCGVHGDWDVWRRDFTKVLDVWDPFRQVPFGPRAWTYITPDPEGRVWGVRYDARQEKATLLTFRRRGPVLEIRGHGEYRLATRRCRLVVTAPVRRDLTGCW